MEEEEQALVIGDFFVGWYEKWYGNLLEAVKDCEAYAARDHSEVNVYEVIGGEKKPVWECDGRVE
jgi:hypothetical protein